MPRSLGANGWLTSGCTGARAIETLASFRLIARAR
jgi:hypothetical protein